MTPTMEKQNVLKTDKPPRRWLWFVALYVISLVVVGGGSFILQLIVNRLN